MPRTTRLYIAGPMTGYKDHNFPAFEEAAANLRKAGYEVISPHEIDTGGSKDWHFCMRKDIPELCKCDGIATLFGYANSRGAQAEVYIGALLDMKIFDLSIWLHPDNSHLKVQPS